MNIELQVLNRVTSHLRLSEVYIRTRNRQFSTVEVICLAVGDVNSIVCFVSRHNANNYTEDRITAVNGRYGVIENTRFAIRLSSIVECACSFAQVDSLLFEVRRHNLQYFERINGVISHFRLQGIIVYSSAVDELFVPQIWQFGLTQICRVFEVPNSSYSQMESIDNRIALIVFCTNNMLEITTITNGICGICDVPSIRFVAACFCFQLYNMRFAETQIQCVFCATTKTGINCFAK